MRGSERLQCRARCFKVHVDVTSGERVVHTQSREGPQDTYLGYMKKRASGNTKRMELLGSLFFFF